MTMTLNCQTRHSPAPAPIEPKGLKTKGPAMCLEAQSGPLEARRQIAFVLYTRADSTARVFESAVLPTAARPLRAMDRANLPGNRIPSLRMLEHELMNNPATTPQCNGAASRDRRGERLTPEIG